MNPKIIYLVAGLLWGFLLTYLFIEVINRQFSIPATVKSNEVISYTPTPTYPNQYELEIMVSEYRIEKGLTALRHDKTLCEIASVRSSEIVGDWSHNGFQKYKSTQRPLGYYGVGENISKWFYKTDEVLNGWKSSQTHNDNLLDKGFNSTCVRCQESYCVQIFGAK